MDILMSPLTITCSSYTPSPGGQLGSGQKACHREREGERERDRERERER